MTTTNEDLRHAMTRLTRDMQSGGLDTSRLHLEAGSKTYGRAFRLYNRDPQSGGLGTVPGMSSSGFLGMTKAEAVQSLDMLAQGIRMALEARA